MNRKLKNTSTKFIFEFVIYFKKGERLSIFRNVIIINNNIILLININNYNIYIRFIYFKFLNHS